MASTSALHAEGRGFNPRHLYFCYSHSSPVCAHNTHSYLWPVRLSLVDVVVVRLLRQREELRLYRVLVHVQLVVEVLLDEFEEFFARNVVY